MGSRRNGWGVGRVLATELHEEARKSVVHTVQAREGR